MADPFATGLGALFSAACSVAAVYVPAAGTPYQVRAILGGKDEELPVGGGAIVATVTVIQLRRAQVPQPEQGDFVVLGGQIVGDQVIGGDVYELTGEAMSDIERITWSIGAEQSDASALP